MVEAYSLNNHISSTHRGRGALGGIDLVKGWESRREPGNRIWRPTGGDNCAADEKKTDSSKITRLLVDIFMQACSLATNGSI